MHSSLHVCLQRYLRMFVLYRCMQLQMPGHATTMVLPNTLCQVIAAFLQNILSKHVCLSPELLLLPELLFL